MRVFLTTLLLLSHFLSFQAFGAADGSKVDMAASVCAAIEEDDSHTLRRLLGRLEDEHGTDMTGTWRASPCTDAVSSHLEHALTTGNLKAAAALVRRETNHRRTDYSFEIKPGLTLLDWVIEQQGDSSPTVAKLREKGAQRCADMGPSCPASRIPARVSEELCELAGSATPEALFTALKREGFTFGRDNYLRASSWRIDCGKIRGLSNSSTLLEYSLFRHRSDNTAALIASQQWSTVAGQRYWNVNFQPGPGMTLLDWLINLNGTSWWRGQYEAELRELRELGAKRCVDIPLQCTFVPP